MKKQLHKWRRWFRFHDYIYLTRKLGYDDMEAVSNASAIRGAIHWLKWIRLSVNVSLNWSTEWPE